MVFKTTYGVKSIATNDLQTAYYFMPFMLDERRATLVHNNPFPPFGLLY